MSSVHFAAAAAPRPAIPSTKKELGRDKELEQDQKAFPTPAPAWTEMKTKAGKERKRLPLACKSCRRKKVRCSGETPACKHCLRSRIPCVYKVTQRKATPRTDYMVMLDKRLKRMEERVIKLMPPADSAKMAAIGRASVKPPTLEKGGKATSKKRAAVEAFATETDEPKSVQPSFKDSSDTSSLMEGKEHLPPREIQEHLAETFFESCYGQPYHLLHKPSFMRRLREGSLPAVLMLAVCSVSARFSSHPYFSGELPTVRGEQYATEARRIASRSFGEPNLTTIIVVTLLALYDFGSCQGGRAWMHSGIAMRMCYALQLNQEYEHDAAGITAGDRREQRGGDGGGREDGVKEAEGRGGGAVGGSKGVTTGSHVADVKADDQREKDTNDSLSGMGFTDQEIRRRTMWSCYLMDVFNSSGTKRPIFDHVKHLKIQLPIKEAYFQMEVPGRTEDIVGRPGTGLLPDDYDEHSKPHENMGVAAYLVKTLAMWSKVVQYSNTMQMDVDKNPPWHVESRFAKLEAEVKQFGQKLPNFLRYTPETFRSHDADKLGSQFAFLHIIYQQIILFLYKFTIPAFPGSEIPPEMPKEFLNKARRSAVEAAGKISKIIDDAKNVSLTAPFASYCTFASSTVHIWGMFSKEPKLVGISKGNLSINMRYLSRMKRYWSMVHYMTESLKDIYRQHADAAKSVGLDASRKLSDELFPEYADLRDLEKAGDGSEEQSMKSPQSPNSKARNTDLSSKSNVVSVGDWYQTKGHSPHLSSTEIPNRPAKRGKQNHASMENLASRLETASAASHTPTPPDTTAANLTPISKAQKMPQHFPPTGQSGFAPASNPYRDRNLAASFSMASLMNNPNSSFGRLPVQSFDRQLVYGAYAQDPSFPYVPSAFETSGFDTPADSDLPALTMLNGALDPGMASQLGMNAASAAGFGASTSMGGLGDANAAWLTPFHLVPPVNLVQPEFSAAAMATGQGDDMNFAMNPDGAMAGMEFWNT